MLNTIKQFFESNLALLDDNADSKAQQVTKLQLASAALLYEVINSDHQQDTREIEALAEVLESSLQLESGKLQEIMELARSEAQQATSLYEFTQLINGHYDYSEKLQLMENLWRVAYADSELDKYEDHLIRKVAELIYVSHTDFIRTKLKIRDSAGQKP